MKKFLRTLVIFIRLKAEEISGPVWNLIKMIGVIFCVLGGVVVGGAIVATIIGEIFVGFAYIIYEPIAVLWILHSCPEPFDLPLPFDLGVAILPGMHVICAMVFFCIFGMMFIEGKKFVVANWQKAKKLEAGEPLIKSLPD